MNKKTLQWISVKDRLPNIGDKILITDGDYIESKEVVGLDDLSNWYVCNSGCRMSNYEITHWAYYNLPEIKNDD